MDKQEITVQKNITGISESIIIEICSISFKMGHKGQFSPAAIKLLELGIESFHNKQEAPKAPLLLEAK